ncbi:MAG: adenylate/guanylate cyclase domain-containing protein [bacterium]
MFTDLEGSTSFWHNYGEDAEKPIADHIKIVKKTIARYGKVENFTGDGFMLSFENVPLAIQCAFELQKEWNAYRKRNEPGEKLAMRIGIHFGSVVRVADGYLLGDAVNIAKRTESACKTGEKCVVTQTAFNNISRKTDFKFGNQRKVSHKGMFLEGEYEGGSMKISDNIFPVEKILERRETEELKEMGPPEKKTREYIEAERLINKAYELSQARETVEEIHAGKMRKRLHEVIDLSEKALQTFTLEVFPSDFAMTQNNLGVAYRNIAEISEAEKKKDLLLKAVAAFEAALEVYTRKDFSSDFAMTQNNLGIAYAELAVISEAEEKKGLLKKAVAAFEAALEIYTRKDFPAQFATAQNNLGIAFRNIAEISEAGEKKGLLQKAVAAFEAALEIYTRKDFPEQFAITQNNLGITYDKLAEVSEGKEKEDIKEKARMAYKNAKTGQTGK